MLDLSYQSITDDEVRVIIALQQNIIKSVTSLNLSCNNFTLSEPIAELIIDNKNITSLSIGLNPIDDIDVLYKAIPLSGVKILNLDDLHITSIGALIPTVLTELYLDRNNLGDDIKRIAGWLNTSQLRVLGLCSNRIYCEHLIGLANALSTNTTLVNLDLSYNRIATIGSTALGMALSKNKTLKYLDLQYNNNVVGIADSLKVNNTLQTLFINSSQTADITSIVDSLKVNISLRSLYFSPRSHVDWVDLLDHNISLITLSGVDEPAVYAKLDRNVALRKRIVQICLLLTKIKPRDIAYMLARAVYETRGDHAWLN